MARIPTLNCAGTKDRWEKGWGENLEAYKRSGDIADLRPKYIRTGQPLRLNGKFVMPGDDTFAAAAAGADWFSAPGMGISLVNQPGDTAYPVVTASFILMYKQPADKAAAAEVLKFFDWAFKNGKQMALDLEYVPLPDKLTNDIRSRVWSQIAR
jgi:hypothetical protein